MKEEKDIKDSTTSTELSLKDTVLSTISYTKTNKLLIALYIVTDVIDINEPLRNKLIILCADILSYIYSRFSARPAHINSVIGKINELLSFLGVTEALNLISGMNSRILQKEFIELRQSLQALNSDLELTELFEEQKEDISNINLKNPKEHSIGHAQLTRIGVQRGNTLMKALSDKISLLSDNKFNATTTNSFDLLKKQRRDEIIRIIKDNSSNYPNGLTITDIKNSAKNLAQKLDIKALSSCGEKTLQRELSSMIKDNVLNKTGSKRWSRYFLIK